ncbi:MAG: hypothetical protein OSJ74_07180 [Clostridia bacterium]|uniref:hypothetical protein n=1 Tax=Pumilibacter muris TaxID=2941510 RepID=UPI0020413C14|nr:hypothetical protein [Pumilibacter muris]MCX4363146.1 hypothetical protein [Clostridia bacterium]
MVKLKTNRDIEKLLSERANFAKMVLATYKPEIAAVCLRLKRLEQIGEKELESLFDAIIDYCFDFEIAGLFDELCEAAEQQYPELVQDYRRYYSEQWE